MAPSTHSRFSASASAGLLACPARYALTLKLEQETGGARQSTIFSAEGTLAHALAETAIMSDCELTDFLGREMTADGFTFSVTDDMIADIQTYVDYVRGLKALGYEVLLEQVVSPSTLWEGLAPLPEPLDLFGTSDVVAYHRDTKDLRIVDLKFGRGVSVEAEGNSQLRYYAAGALGAAQTLFGQLGPNGTVPVKIKTVTVTIVQPRAYHPKGPVRWADHTADEITQWARTTLYEGVVRAMTDNGQTICAGPQCRFCPVAPHCAGPAQFSFQTAQAAFMVTPPTNLPASTPSHMALPQVSLSDAALGDLMNKIEIIGPWIESVRSLALQRLEAGQPVEGWKLVPKRASRKWADEDAQSQIETLASDPKVTDEMLDAITEVKLLSPAQAEKKLGKKQFDAAVAAHVVKTSSGMTLAPEVDPRSVVARRSAQEAFGITAGGTTASRNHP